ncbi:MAG: carboxyltransferase domain-containing protein, partial [Pseudomonadota bacterium]
MADGGTTEIPEPRYLPFGDAALIVEFGREKDRSLSALVLALDAALAAAPPEGVVETAPSFRSLLVQFDPLVTDGPRLQAAIQGVVAQGFAAAEKAGVSIGAHPGFNDLWG